MKEQYQIRSIMFVILFCGLVLLPNSISYGQVIVSADLSTTEYFEHGASFHNGTDVKMPEAYAEITVTHNENNESIYIKGQYQIFSEETQNATLAFVYPETWLQWGGKEDTFPNMTIFVNSTKINYTTYSWDNLGWNASEYEDIVDDGDWLTESAYAVFNVELLANSSIIIEVEAEAVFICRANYLSIQYIVGSARTFDSNTHQIVNVTIIENAPLAIADDTIYFIPGRYARVYPHGDITNIIWDFSISDFTYNSISVHMYINKFTPMIPSPTTTTTTTTAQLLDTIGPVAVSVILGVLTVGCIVILSKLRS